MLMLLYATPVTLDPLECKYTIRHLNGTNNKILNSEHYNRIFTLFPLLPRKIRTKSNLFTVYQRNKMYTGTFTFMSADKN